MERQSRSLQKPQSWQSSERAYDFEMPLPQSFLLPCASDGLTAESAWHSHCDSKLR
jgi:hypothetical protein